MAYILLKAEEYKNQGFEAREAAVKLFAELKTVRMADIRLLVDIAYL